MDTTVSAHVTATVVSPARLVLQVAVAGAPDEASLQVSVDGVEVARQWLGAPSGGHVWTAPTGTGRLDVSYRARRADQGQAAPVVADDDEVVYLRPSRYCESDRLAGFAAREFRGITRPADLLAAVSSWVGTRIDYQPGSSGPTDGAVDTLLSGRGVCRDFAHLAISLLRALDVPARLAAVYAPGLEPMDFHAVVEALVDGAWFVIDPTLLAPRRSLVRIATGRDAADTAFLSNYGGDVLLHTLTVTATVSGALPVEDVEELVQLA